MWNQREATLQRESRTNNAAEGWNNRYQILAGKNHPSVFQFLKELLHEQGHTEYILREISLGHSFKKQYHTDVQREDRLFNVVNSYHTYAVNNRVEYLKNVSFYLHVKFSTTK